MQTIIGIFRGRDNQEIGINKSFKRGCDKEGKGICTFPSWDKPIVLWGKELKGTN